MQADRNLAFPLDRFRELEMRAAIGVLNHRHFSFMDLFREMGGFAEVDIMEDFELVSRLRRRGRIVIAPAAVATSARRWNEQRHYGKRL